MIVQIPRLVIAAPASGSGKTTIATALMAALTRRAWVVQGFKIGPDYIDLGYHTAATGRVSRNLDTWMLPQTKVREVFARVVSNTDIAIIEGVMGLFDGYEGTSESGSTAEVAKLLDAPVILVLDVSRMSRSAAALALGCRLFDPALRVVGVICNNVGSERHAAWVTRAIEAVGLPVLGCLPRSDQLKIPERHLGLQTAVERGPQLPTFLTNAADLVAQSVDLDRVIEMAQDVLPIEVEQTTPQLTPSTSVRIGVAHDEAFCFYYEDNFDLLRLNGAEIVFFSPLHDTTLPKDIAGLYLGGGYPELYAVQLAENATLLDSLRNVVHTGLPVYAECGGLMYLTQSITTVQGECYPMAGVVPGHSRMQNKRTIGYRTLTAVSAHPFLAEGTQLRGHEFHYSEWIDCPADLPHVYEIAPRGEEPIRCEGFGKDNILASYIHLHFGVNDGLATNFIAACRGYAKETSGQRW